MAATLFIRQARLRDLDGIQEIEDACFGEHGYDRKLFAEYSHKCDRAELISVAVAPRYRGKGVATALMDAILRRIRRRKVARFYLMVKVTNSAAIAMYEKYGFERRRLVRRYYEDGTDGRRMAKYWN